MAVREIPVRNDIAAYSFSVDLDNITYNFNFKFNDRTNLWSIDISNDAEVLLVAGIPLFVKQDLLQFFRHESRLPQGTLFAANLVNENLPPDRDNLGTEVVLLYDEVV